MAVRLEHALDDWFADDDVAVVLIDAAGEKAFCAGGDIADLYARGKAGDYDFGREFWRQEYRLNLKIATYPKPVVAFMQGFTMGGGVGVACHASHRIVCESSKIAMPECGIGLIPDVGGSFLLGRNADELGAYLGLTGGRMGAEDAIYAGFADVFVPEAEWDTLKVGLVKTADVSLVEGAAQPAFGGELAGQTDEINHLFAGATLVDIADALASSGTEFADAAAKRFAKPSPLAMSCALRAIRAARTGGLADALKREYRFTYRAQAQGDFIEGIRAQIIDRDFAPKWRHTSFAVPQGDIDAMLADLGSDEWTHTGRAT
jgi:enoyl-CoA hydratase/carnithine racemase